MAEKPESPDRRHGDGWKGTCFSNSATFYVPMVADGGLIALHDIVSGRPEAVGGLPDFWREARGELFDEIVADRD